MDGVDNARGNHQLFCPDAVVDPRVGGAFQIHINPLAEPGMKGADDMRFLALQPRKMLSFDWNAPPSLPEARQQRTFVVVRLTPVDDKSTRVSIHHTGWGDGGEWDKAYTYFDRAWGNVLINLRKRFETGPMDWTDWLAQLKKMREWAEENRDDAAKNATTLPRQESRRHQCLHGNVTAIVPSARSPSSVRHRARRAPAPRRCR